MDRAEILRILRPDLERQRATEALAGALHLLETSEHEYVSAMARKDAMDMELKTKRAETDTELTRLHRTQEAAFREMANACAVEKARLTGTLEGLKREIDSLTSKKTTVQGELSVMVTERNRRIGELDAKVRDLESRVSVAEKFLDAAMEQAKR